MRTILTLSMTALTLSLFAASPSFAEEGCKCTKKCMTSCQKGNSKKCDCHACDCSKNKKCSEHEGQCKAHEAEDKT